MAKKVKTPEEVQAKIDKKVWKRKIFFGTFTKTLAFFLAIAMVFTLAMIAFEKPKAAVSGGTTTTTTDDDNALDDMFGDDDSTSGDSNSTPSGDNNTPSGDNNNAQTPGDNSGNNNNSGNSGNATAKLSKAEFASLLNKVTADAAKGSYDVKRVSSFKITELTGKSAIDALIKLVTDNNDWPGDDGYTVDDVVGNFIGAGTYEGKVANGKAPEDMKENYLLKAMKLTEADIKDNNNKGNVYAAQLVSVDNPQRTGSNSLYNATNDFLTHQDVVDGLKEGLGSFADKLKLEGTDVKYSKITINATIDNEKLTKLEIKFAYDAVLNLKVGLSVTGKGTANTTLTYTNIAY